MARSSKYIANEFIGHLKYLEITRSKMEQLFNKRYIVRRDIEQVYEGLYIDAITSFESFIEKLFIGIMVGNIVHDYSKVIPRMKFSSYIVARDVLYGGRNYVDWFPYERFAEKRARSFFRNGWPFTCLEKSNKSDLERIMTIRNALAHKSAHAISRFKNDIIALRPLLPIERTPAGYLRSKFRINPIQTQYENIIITLSEIAIELCTCKMFVQKLRQKVRGVIVP
jgi:hypothetical protein